MKNKSNNESSSQGNEELNSVDNKNWRQMYSRLRSEASAVIAVGSKVGIAAGLIGMAGLLNWCGYCGGWHGGPPPHRPEAEPAPPVPDILNKFIRAEIEMNNESATSPGKWQEGGFVDGEPAKVRKSGDKIEFLWGGEGDPDGPYHGHIVSHDEPNANYVREPGPERDTPVDDRRINPYAQDDAGRYNFE